MIVAHRLTADMLRNPRIIKPINKLLARASSPISAVPLELTFNISCAEKDAMVDSKVSKDP